VELGHAVGVGRELEREHGHAEALVLVVRPLATKSEEILPLQAELLRPAPEVFFHQVEAEALVAGRNGSVRREDVRGPDSLRRLIEGEGTLDHDLANALEGQKGRVPLVHVRHHDIDAEDSKGAYAADAEEYLLTNPGLRVAAV